jgi:hypothetical protein
MPTDYAYRLNFLDAQDQRNREQFLDSLLGLGQTISCQASEARKNCLAQLTQAKKDASANLSLSELYPDQPSVGGEPELERRMRMDQWGRQSADGRGRAHRAPGQGRELS